MKPVDYIFSLQLSSMNFNQNLYIVSIFFKAKILIRKIFTQFSLKIEKFKVLNNEWNIYMVKISG